MLHEENPDIHTGQAKPQIPAPCHLRWRLLADHLPPQPFWLQQLNGVLNAGTIDLARAAELIGIEPIFCAEFMRISRLAEPFSRADRLEDLLVLLGSERARTVAAGAFLTSFLAAQDSSPLTDFLRRTERLGSMSSRLALSSTETDAAEAYVAGLVHYVGALPLLRTLNPSDLSSTRLDFTPESITSQRFSFGTDIIELGQAVALLWDYPLALGQSLRVSLQAVEDVPNSPLACIVRAADQLCAAGLTPSNIPSDITAQPAPKTFKLSTRLSILPFYQDRNSSGRVPRRTKDSSGRSYLANSERHGDEL
jgi:HD-like signal output (HDOD) protein